LTKELDRNHFPELQGGSKNLRMNKAPLGAKRKDCAGAKQNPATKDRSESGSTEVRKERSEGTLRKKYRRGAKPLD